MTRKLAADIPDCRVVSFPEAARLIPEEVPDELALLVSSFISPHVGRADSDPDELAESPDETVVEDAGTPEGGLA